MKKLVPIFGVVSLLAVVLVVVVNLWLSSLTFRLVEPSFELDQGVGQYAKAIENVELKALVDFPQGCDLELGDDVSASFRKGTKLELDMNVEFQVDDSIGVVSLVPVSVGLISDVPVSVLFKKCPVVEIKKLGLSDSAEAEKEKQISVEARTALGHLFVALLMGSTEMDGGGNMQEFPSIELPLFKAVLRGNEPIEFLQPLNVALGSSPSEIEFSNVKVESGKWAEGAFRASLSLKDSLATDEFILHYPNEISLDLEGSLESDMDSSTLLEIGKVRLAIDDANFQTSSGGEKAVISKLNLMGAGNLAFAHNWDVNTLSLTGTIQSVLSDFRIKNQNDTVSAKSLAIEGLDWRFDLEPAESRSAASFSNRRPLVLNDMTWERSEPSRGVRVGGVDLTLSPGRFSSDKAIEVDLSKAIAAADLVAISMENNRKLTCRGIKGEVDGLASRIQVGANDNWLPSGSMKINGTITSVQLEEDETTLVNANDLIVKLNVGMSDKGLVIQGEIRTSAKLTSNINGIPMSLKKAGIRVDTGPVLIDIADDKKEVAVKQLRVRVNKKALVTAIQQSIPNSTKPERADVGGRDLGRFLSMGTVKDYRVRWNAYKIQIPHVKFGSNSAEVVAKGTVKAVLEADVITTRMKVVGKTKVPTVRWKMKKFGFVKTKVPEIYTKMVEIKVPEVHHKWKDGPSATIALGLKGRIDFVLPQKTPLANAKIGGKVKLQSFDIKNFPGWVEKKLLNPLLSKAEPKTVEKKILDLLTPEEIKQFENIWVQSSNLSTQGDDVVLTVSGNLVLN